MGPQTRFLVPEGILDYRGSNVVGFAVWALEPGAVVTGFKIEAGTPVRTGRDPLEMVKGMRWVEREGAY